MTSYAVAGDVAWVSREDLDSGDQPAAYVTRLPDGPPMVLEGPACVVWLAVADGGTAEEVVARTAELAGVGAAVVRDDVTRLLAELMTAGLVRASG